ncbi:hypothetical protein ACHAWF_013203 [Thalassiosira exigua]
MSLKAHRNLWKTRPIVCRVGTLLNHIGRWLEHQFQKLKALITTYIKGNHHLLDLLHSLRPLSPYTKLFTTDANWMYTNINTAHAIQVISAWLDSTPLLGDFPVLAVKEAMVLVMKNNSFGWGDMYFLQLLGTTMGTLAACIMWATIYFAVHKMGLLLLKYQNNLLLFCRFIGDMIGIWVGNGATSHAFKQDADNFSIITWEFEEPSKSVAFLDLSITIEGSSLTTKTYQKAMNLYQYIPPQSAYPPVTI